MKNIKVISLSAIVFLAIASTVTFVSCQKNSKLNSEVVQKGSLELPKFTQKKSRKPKGPKDHWGIIGECELGSWSWQITAGGSKVWYCEGLLGLCTKSGKRWGLWDLFGASNTNPTTNILLLEDDRIALELNETMKNAVVDGYLTISPDISDDNLGFRQDSQGRYISGIQFDDSILDVINLDSLVVFAGSYEVQTFENIEYIILN